METAFKNEILDVCKVNQWMTSGKKANREVKLPQTSARIMFYL